MWVVRVGSASNCFTLSLGMLVLEWLAELGEIGLIISHWECGDGVCVGGRGY